MIFVKEGIEMKRVLEFLAVCYIIGEMITVYTMIACTSLDAPFPVWFRGAWIFYLVTMGIVVAGVLAAISVVSVSEIKRWSRKKRRLGMVRMDVNTGRWFYENVRNER
jgi:hypothetical protein